MSEEEPVIVGGGAEPGRETLARSLSREEDMLQVQHEPDGAGPIDGGKITMRVGNRTTKSLYVPRPMVVVLLSLAVSLAASDYTNDCSEQVPALLLEGQDLVAAHAHPLRRGDWGQNL